MFCNGELAIVTWKINCLIKKEKLFILLIEINIFIHDKVSDWVSRYAYLHGRKDDMIKSFWGQSSYEKEY